MLSLKFNAINLCILSNNLHIILWWKIELFDIHAKRYVVKNQTARHQNNIIPSMKHGGHSKMLWGSRSSKGTREPVKTGMDGAKYSGAEPKEVCKNTENESEIHIPTGQWPRAEATWSGLQEQGGWSGVANSKPWPKSHRKSLEWLEGCCQSAETNKPLPARAVLQRRVGQDFQMCQTVQSHPERLVAVVGLLPSIDSEGWILHSNDILYTWCQGKTTPTLIYEIYRPQHNNHREQQTLSRITCCVQVSRLSKFRRLSISSLTSSVIAHPKRWYTR